MGVHALELKNAQDRGGTQGARGFGTAVSGWIRGDQECPSKEVKTAIKYHNVVFIVNSKTTNHKKNAIIQK